MAKKIAGASVLWFFADQSEPISHSEEKKKVTHRGGSQPVSKMIVCYQALHISPQQVSTNTLYSAVNMHWMVVAVNAATHRMTRRPSGTAWMLLPQNTSLMATLPLLYSLCGGEHGSPSRPLKRKARNRTWTIPDTNKFLHKLHFANARVRVRVEVKIRVTVRVGVNRTQTQIP